MEYMNPPIIKLPSYGSEISIYLENFNQYETGIASTYIRERLAEPLRTKVLSWFKIAPPELDRALFRKLTNSTLAAGDAGLERTIEALKQLRFESVPLNLKINPKQAAMELRDDFSDYRAAKNWLENQFKCVNSILKSSKIIGNRASQGLQQTKISNEKEFEIWIIDLVKVWENTTNVSERLRNSYKNNWQIFKVGFDSSLMNGSYQISLKRQIDVYLIPENQREKYFDDLNLEMVKDYSKVHKVKSKYEIQIEISGGEVIFYSILNSSYRNKEKVSKIKNDLIFELSNNLSADLPRIAVSELYSDLPTLCLRMQMPKNKSKYELVSKFINNFFDKI